MKIGISGSRNVKSKELVYFILSYVLDKYKVAPTEVFHGGAEGVDLLADAFFRENFNLIPVKIKPDYKKFKDNPKAAPLERNKDIVKQSEILIALWEGVEYSHGRLGGTRFTKNYALENGVPVIFVNVAEDRIDYLESSGLF